MTILRIVHVKPRQGLDGVFGSTYYRGAMETKLAQLLIHQEDGCQITLEKICKLREEKRSTSSRVAVEATRLAMRRKESERMARWRVRSTTKELSMIAAA
jgi:hypothetical protein